MRPGVFTRRTLLSGLATAGAVFPARLRAAVGGPVLEGLSVENDIRLPYAGDRPLLATISPGGERGRDRAVVRFRLRRAAHVALDALARNTPSEVALASEAAALTGTRVLSSEGRLLRAGEHALSWTPPPSVKPGTYTLRLTVTDLHGKRTVYGMWSPVHPKRPPAPVVRVLGVDAAAAARSYVPGETAQIVVRADARTLTLQLFRSGTETVPTYANDLLNGEPVADPQTVDWATLADAPVPVAVPLPSDLQSGVHYVEVGSGDGRLGFAPFVVRPSQPTRRVAVVMPTSTWQAYNFQDADGDGFGDSWYVSWRTRTVDLTRAQLNRGVPYRYRSYDLAFLHWLAQTGKQVDVYADEDLERFADGDALRASYDLVVFPGHTEYVTTHAYDVIERYRDAGGNLIFLSANNFFRRVDFDGSHITLVDLWRDLGRPESSLVGVQYRASDRGTHQSPFVVTEQGAESFVFRGTNLQAGSTFGRFGIEIDAVTGHSPPGTVVLAEIPDALGPGLTAQMTYYQTEAGARVFAAGALNFGGQVLLWPETTRLLENVWSELAPAES